MCFITTFINFALLLDIDPDLLDEVGGISSSLDNPPRLPHVSYKTAHDLPLINSFTDPDYFTGAFPTLFPFGIGGHLGDLNGNRPEKVSLQTFARYAMLHHSLLYVFLNHNGTFLIWSGFLNTTPSCFIYMT
jgi:hypothetical protein